VAFVNSEPALSIFVDGLSEADVSVIALVSEGEFASARKAIPEWSEYPNYEEWRDSREGFQIGLAMAGVEVRMVPVALPMFLEWCRDTKTPASAGALETFAGLSCDLYPKQDTLLPAAIRASAH
jgi:hypothetical protein